MTQAGARDDADWARDERTQRILAIVAKETGIDAARLQPDSRIEDLGIASLDVVQSIFEIESAFDIEIPPVPSGPGAEFATIGDLISHVLATLDGRHARARQPAGGGGA